MHMFLQYLDPQAQEKILKKIEEQRKMLAIKEYIRKNPPKSLKDNMIYSLLYKNNDYLRPSKNIDEEYDKMSDIEELDDNNLDKINTNDNQYIENNKAKHNLNIDDLNIDDDNKNENDESIKDVNNKGIWSYLTFGNQ